MNTKKSMVIYHTYADKPCHDGFTAAWIACKYLPEDTILIAAKYGDPAPDVTGSDVYVLDFSFPRDVLIRMNEQAAHLVVLDHHATAQRELEGLDFCQFSTERSGAMMAWDFFREDGDTCPELVKHVQDRDLWRWELPHSKGVSAYLTTVRTDFESWTEAARLIQFELEAVVSQGAAVLRYIDQYVEGMKKNSYLVSFEGHKVPMVNAPKFANSELLGELAKKYPFAISWLKRADGLYEYSMRARGSGVDVGEIASRMTYEEHKGGGHANAAGFVLDRLIA